MSEIKIIEVDSETGAGTRGASLGIEALKVAALNKKSFLFKTYPGIGVETENAMLLEKISTPDAKYIDGIVKVYHRVCHTVTHVASNKHFPLVLAGDHSTAGGTIAGLKKAYPDQRLGVIWIDAHADLHSPFTSPSGNVHGMSLATAMAADNEEMAVKKPDAHTKKCWNDLKNTGGFAPKIQPQDLVYIAVRSTEAGEDHLIKKHNIRNFTVEEVKEKSPDAVALETLKILSGCDLIYLSFDVDSLDPTISRGTGTPVENGINKNEAMALIRQFLAHDKVACFEMVEINPTLDHKNKMAETAFEVLEEAIRIIENR